MNKNIAVFLVLIVVLIGGYFIFRSNPNPDLTATDNSMMENDKTTMMAETATVTYADDVFTPSEIKVKVGDKLKFVNNGTSEIEIASGPHPTHTSYPAFESGSLAPGATYEFTATEKVTIMYHNHLNAKAFGKIIVE